MFRLSFSNFRNNCCLLLISLLLFGCSGAVNSTAYDAANGLKGVVQAEDLPVFLPSQVTHRQDWLSVNFENGEQVYTVGYRWVLEYEGKAEDVIKFYDEKLPKESKTMVRDLSGKIIGVEYEYEKGNASFQVQIPMDGETTYEVYENNRVDEAEHRKRQEAGA